MKKRRNKWSNILESDGKSHKNNVLKWYFHVIWRYGKKRTFQLTYIHQKQISRSENRCLSKNLRR